MDPPTNGKTAVPQTLTLRGRLVELRSPEDPTLDERLAAVLSDRETMAHLSAAFGREQWSTAQASARRQGRLEAQQRDEALACYAFALDGEWIGACFARAGGERNSGGGGDANARDRPRRVQPPTGFGGFRSLNKQQAEGGLVLKAGTTRRGIGTESMLLLCDWAFDVFGTARVFLRTQAENDAMMRFCERYGFRDCGVVRSNNLDWREWDVLPERWREHVRPRMQARLQQLPGAAAADTTTSPQ